MFENAYVRYKFMTLLRSTLRFSSFFFCLSHAQDNLFTGHLWIKNILLKTKEEVGIKSFGKVQNS